MILQSESGIVNSIARRPSGGCTRDEGVSFHAADEKTHSAPEVFCTKTRDSFNSRPKIVSQFDVVDAAAGLLWCITRHAVPRWDRSAAVILFKGLGGFVDILGVVVLEQIASRLGVSSIEAKLRL